MTESSMVLSTNSSLLLSEKAFDSNGSSTLTAEEVRSIIREELQDVAFVSAQPSQTQTVQPTLTEEEQAANEQSVLNDLEMFG